MLDETAPSASPAPRCVWCSAVLPSDHETTCPSCGATLVGEGDAAVPGLTSIDADAILRNARNAAGTRPRGGRLLSWISGEYTEDADDAKVAPGSLAPPPADVRREMLRLELEAQVANAQAEVEAMAADAAVESGRPIAPAPDPAAPATTDASAASAPAAGAPPASAPAAPEATEEPPTA